MRLYYLKILPAKEFSMHIRARGILFILGVVIFGLPMGIEATDFRNDLALLYSRGGPERTRQMELIAGRYSIGVSGGVEDINIIRSINPDFLWFAYNSVQDNYVSGNSTFEHDYVMARADEMGINPEINYLHYQDDTRVILEGDTLFIPGWGGGSASSEEEARLPVYWKNKSRIAVNYSNEYSRLFHKEFACSVLSALPEGSNAGYYSGIFWDNSACQLWNVGRIVSGGHVAEHPDHAHVDSLDIVDDNWYWTQLKTFHREFMDTLAISSGWSPDGLPKYSMLNIANSWDDDYAESGVSDYLVKEFCFNPVRNWASYIPASYTEDSLAAAHDVHYVYMPRPYTQLNGYLGSYTYKETLLGGLCWFYITSSESAYIYQQGTNAPGSAAWDTLVWCGAMDYDVGEPLERGYRTAQTGIDGRGYEYTVFTRNYQHATIYLRPRGRWDQHIDDSTEITVNIDRLLRELMPDGGYGQPTTSITFRNGQGRIMIPIDNTPNVPSNFSLSVNPNPFKSSTTINYSMDDNSESQSSFIKLTIYNLAGQKVTTLVDQSRSPGRYSVCWEASGLASGIYFARLNIGDNSITKKIVLVK
jgi:hypothetical protein